MNISPILLVLIGLLLALTKIAPPIALTHDMAFFLILPPILFQAGMQLNSLHLKNDWKFIAFLAIPGVLVSAIIVGLTLAWLWHLPLIEALLFGALISPTDPVSVLAILKQTKSPERLKTILEAESLFNDGTGVVLFMVILGLIQNNHALNIPEALGQFILVTAGGAGIGLACGFIIHQIIKSFVNHHLLGAILSILLAFGTPLLAEHLHCSGIIAVVTAGLIMGTSSKTQATFWKPLDLIMNAVIFLIIGLQWQSIGLMNLLTFKAKILTGIIIVLMTRFLIIYPTIAIYNKLSQNKIPFAWNHLLFWGGLRGTIPMILAIQLPALGFRPMFLTATFGIVLFNLIIQGLSFEPLLKKLKVSNPTLER